MTPSTLTEPTLRPGFAPRADRLFEPGGEPSLDDLISKTWRTLAIRGSALCPVCGATLVRDDVTSTASCGRCGSVLD